MLEGTDGCGDKGAAGGDPKNGIPTPKSEGKSLPDKDFSRKGADGADDSPLLSPSPGADVSKAWETDL